MLILKEFINIFKAFIGTNYLAMPYGFKEAGLGLSLILLALISIITSYCCLLIIKCKRQIIMKLNSAADSHLHRGILTEDVIELLEKDELTQIMRKNLILPEITRICFGKKLSFFITFILFSTQFLFCTGYFIFVATTLANIYDTFDSMASHHSNSTVPGNNIFFFNITSDLLGINVRDEATHQSLKIGIFLLLQFPIYFLFTLIKKVEKLAHFSGISNVSIILGFLVIFVLICINFEISNDFVWFNWKAFPFFFGLTFSSFEGIGTLIPVEESMVRGKHYFSRFLAAAIFGVSTMFALLGSVGYLRFGAEIDQIVTQNLLSQPVAVTLVLNFLLCIAVIFTYPLQVYPCIEVLEKVLVLIKHRNKTSDDAANAILGGRRGSDNNSDGSLDYGTTNPQIENITNDEEGETDLELSRGSQRSLRAINRSIQADDLVQEGSMKIRVIFGLLVVSLQIICAFIFRDYFAYLSAINGSMGSSILSYILPCIVHLYLFWDYPGYFWILCLDVVLLLFGIIGGGVSLYVSIAHIISSST